jgi:hypothetical protein
LQATRPVGLSSTGLQLHLCGAGLDGCRFRRHPIEHAATLSARDALCRSARERHPRHASGNTRNRAPIGPVSIRSLVPRRVRLRPVAPA